MSKKLTEDEKEANKIAKKIARELAKEEKEKLAYQRLIESEKNQRPISSIVITIEWKKSNMYGRNPHASAKIIFKDGKYEHLDGYTCSGYGYDKESTVIAKVFNDTLRYKLWEINPVIKEALPYGIRIYEGNEPSRGYEGGVGTSCYFSISKFIGGNFVNTASGNSFDVYTYTDVTI